MANNFVYKLGDIQLANHSIDYLLPFAYQRISAILIPTVIAIFAFKIKMPSAVLPLSLMLKFEMKISDFITILCCENCSINTPIAKD